MFENIISFFKKLGKKETLEAISKNTAKERLQLVLMQDRANVSADFLDMMRQEIIEVIKKYIDVDESQIDVKLTNKTNEDGTVGAPALYANIPIAGIKENVKKQEQESEDNKTETDKEKDDKKEEKVEENKEDKKEDTKKEESKKEKKADKKPKKEENEKTEDKSEKAEKEEPKVEDEDTEDDKQDNQEEPKEE